MLFERGGLWSGVIGGRDAVQFELKTRDPPAGPIVVDSETWQGANIGPPFGWTNNSPWACSAVYEPVVLEFLAGISTTSESKSV
jgi:hypothetical protein